MGSSSPLGPLYAGALVLVSLSIRLTNAESSTCVPFGPRRASPSPHPCPGQAPPAGHTGSGEEGHASKGSLPAKRAENSDSPTVWVAEQRRQKGRRKRSKTGSLALHIQPEGQNAEHQKAHDDVPMKEVKKKNTVSDGVSGRVLAELESVEKQRWSARKQQGPPPNPLSTPEPGPLPCIFQGWKPRGLAWGCFLLPPCTSSLGALGCG